MTFAGEAAWTTWDGPVPADLIELARRCRRADGGLPLADDPAFLRRRWTAPAGARFALRARDGALLAAGAITPIAGATPPVPEATTSAGGGMPPVPDATTSAGGGMPPVPDATTSAAGVMSPTGGAISSAAGVMPPASWASSSIAGVIVTGLVDPDARGRGLGARVLDHALALVGDVPVTVETESLTTAAEALFASRGLRQVFAEDVMRIDPSAAPAPVWPPGMALSEWSAATAWRFHAVYTASFRDRPGFPGDPAAEWIADNEDEDDFRPGWSLLATLPGAPGTFPGAPAASTLGPAASTLDPAAPALEPAASANDWADPSDDGGFVTASVGWIIQVGVVPSARGRGIGAALVCESLRRMAADGATEAWLDVNVDNPSAAALYRRLGFTVEGRRARYRR